MSLQQQIKQNVLY